ncbi:MAG: hypothetical protein RQ826_04090 [Xanthomonadales bacterium]|nr:hypothetical protein [Xanthomonadales bacterium]
MIQSLMMFFATPEPPQATVLKPSAVPVALRCAQRRAKQSLRFAVSVVVNAVGFGALVGACWFSLQLMQAFLFA